MRDSETMRVLDKIEYKPMSVREILVKMKDLSEFMIDLAYSAALLNDKELANEVMRLEKRVDTLTYLLDMNVMVAVRNPSDAEALVSAAVVSSATDKISDAAADIAAIVLGDIGVHPIVRDAFTKVEERICCIKVEPKSVLTGKRLDELELAKIGVNIIAIRRENEWIVNPKPEEKINDEDSLIVRGTPGGTIDLRNLAKRFLQEGGGLNFGVGQAFSKDY